ncbi:MAG: hypothetical protein VX061_03395 [Pseudomonadota bacterium]|nr:hypothetical protein [Pseudomonadota bacterium]
MSASYFPPIISSIYLEELAGQATAAKDSALVALNAAEAARDTALEYRNDAQTYYTQVQQIQEGDYVTNLSLEERLGAFNFADLQGIPATFAPSAHGHSWSEIANKPTMYPPTAHGHAWSEITGKPSEFEPAPHIHTWQQIAQKPGTFPPETHFHSWNEIENKPNVFNPAAHTHSWGDISGKPTKFEPAAHTHSWDLIENKPLTFPPQSHHHHWSQVTSKPEQATRWPHFSEVTNKPVQATRWPKYSEVTETPNFGSGAFKNVGNAEGELVEVGFSGLGRAAAKSGYDIDESGVQGLDLSFFVSSVNAPSFFSTNKRGWALNLGGVGTTATAQLVFDFDANTIGYRRRSSDKWVELVHSGNAEFNEFGGVSANDYLARGYVRNSTSIRFLLPVSCVGAVTGITISGQVTDFQAYNINGGVINFEGASMFLTGLSSNKVAVIEVGGLSGLRTGDDLLLETLTAEAKITVHS